MGLDHKKIWVIFFLLLITLLFSRLNDQKDQNAELEDMLSEYEEALNQANNNIEEASWYAWESYEDMGYALESLETVDVR